MDYYDLCEENLNQISGVVQVPTYDRSQIKAGIMHIGVGGFHRSHQAYYTDMLLHDESASNWGICGVSLLESDLGLYQKLKNQDNLYTLTIKEFDGSLTKKVIGSIVEMLYGPENPSEVIQKIANPDIRVITLTITEGGYNRNDATGEFNIENPLIKHDIQNPESPKTVFGYLTEGLKLRKEKGLKGITIQSCDNIQENGKVAKEMLLSYIEMANSDLLDWVEENVSFPNSMVDRITPSTTQADIETLLEETGVKDLCPVVCEPFEQWVIEDGYVNSRPQWEKVGVQFVEDVLPYERMKLNLLNAGHSVLGIIGSLIGYQTIDEVVENNTVRAFVERFMVVEVFPVLGDIKGVNLEEYKNSLIKRFGNAYIKDTVERICSESSVKIPVFILSAVKQRLLKGGSVDYSSFVIAAWAKYCLLRNQNGGLISYKDKMKNELFVKAEQAKKKPEDFLKIDSIFGEIQKSESFVEAYRRSYGNIKMYGVEESIKKMNSN